ncbi:hypothetical protein BDP55DRAFT_670315 [Colletotrichum godetiae]|uniref:Uncharacterized protein n=1 Tax=Colletotrichum godetiae TaxID=1209918 RepID=A0AAJ0AGH3_9PEZI|nr:uncharacterized protein BDP55DRAFT_670315 [Colletotrichum godetiae]KAK1673470.1 hypothetical protein BDP55DRAFT_670315 [Colletotrichum godetiae]
MVPSRISAQKYGVNQFAPCSASPFGKLATPCLASATDIECRTFKKTTRRGDRLAIPVGVPGTKGMSQTRHQGITKIASYDGGSFYTLCSVPVCILRTNTIQHSAHDWSCFAVLTFELETVFGIRIHPPSVARPRAPTYHHRLPGSLSLRPCFWETQVVLPRTCRSVMQPEHPSHGPSARCAEDTVTQR